MNTITFETTLKMDQKADSQQIANFLNDNKDEIIECILESFADDFVEKIREKFEDKITKEICILMAEKANKEVKQDMIDEITKDALSKLSNLTLKATKQKNKKDKDSPKRPNSPYMIWLAETRDKIKKVGMNSTSVAKEAGALWRGMSEEEKAPYIELSTQDKQRYEREMQEYREKKEKE